MHQLGFNIHICSSKASFFSNSGGFIFYQELAIS